MDRIRVGVIGLGYWGPNLARNFSLLPDCELVWCCDESEQALQRLSPLYPRTRFTHEVEDLFQDETLDALVVATHGGSYLQPGVEDTVFCFLRFPSGVRANLHLSWLDPHKERLLRVVGSRRMATFDAMATERQVTVYDKGFDQDPHALGSYVTRFGEVWSPSVPRVEALRLECAHFLECI